MKEVTCCLICDAQGVDGIRINDKLICLSCEETLVRILAQDLEYDNYLNKVRALLFANS